MQQLAAPAERSRKVWFVAEEAAVSREDSGGFVQAQPPDKRGTTQPIPAHPAHPAHPSPCRHPSKHHIHIPVSAEPVSIG